MLLGCTRKSGTAQVFLPPVILDQCHYGGVVITSTCLSCLRDIGRKKVATWPLAFPGICRYWALGSFCPFLYPGSQPILMGFKELGPKHWTFWSYKHSRICQLNNVCICVSLVASCIWICFWASGPLLYLTSIHWCHIWTWGFTVSYFTYLAVLLMSNSTASYSRSLWHQLFLWWCELTVIASIHF